jgi:hypothetical protein
MSYLIMIVVPEPNASVVDSLFQMATSFLGTAAVAERKDRGSYRRPARGSAPDELLRLVEFSAEGAASDSAKARALEGVLRSTLASVGTKTGEVRVFVSES